MKKNQPIVWTLKIKYDSVFAKELLAFGCKFDYKIRAWTTPKLSRLSINYRRLRSIAQLADTELFPYNHNEGGKVVLH